MPYRMTLSVRHRAMPYEAHRFLVGYLPRTATMLSVSPPCCPCAMTPERRRRRASCGSMTLPPALARLVDKEKCLFCCVNQCAHYHFVPSLTRFRNKHTRLLIYARSILTLVAPPRTAHLSLYSTPLPRAPLSLDACALCFLIRQLQR